MLHWEAAATIAAAAAGLAVAAAVAAADLAAGFAGDAGFEEDQSLRSCCRSTLEMLFGQFDRDDVERMCASGRGGSKSKLALDEDGDTNRGDARALVSRAWRRGLLLSSSFE